MLRMQPFTAHYPTTLDDVTALLDAHGASAMICAGGTDVVPNLKHELFAPEHVIHLAHVHGLHGITEHSDKITIGSTTTIDAIASNNLLQTHAPGLCDAASHVAGPQLRRMGTLGGNLCLDTRCLYYNQTYFWREALGFCLKKDGTTCHVTQTGKRCVAASSNDTATMLICLDAKVDLVAKSGLRTLSLIDFYKADGMKNNVLSPGELLLRVHVPKADSTIKRLEGFAKLRHRSSIDYPMLSVGVRFDVDDDLQIKNARATLNALAAKPKVIQTDWLTGIRLDEATINQLADYTYARCTPLTNICDDPDWRKEMVRVYMKRACQNALARLEARA